MFSILHSNSTNFSSLSLVCTQSMTEHIASSSINSFPLFKFTIIFILSPFFNISEVNPIKINVIKFSSDLNPDNCPKSKLTSKASAN